MNFTDQAEVFMRNLEIRKRSPAKPATIAAYRSYLSNWILPELGQKLLRNVENGAMKILVDKMAEAGLSPSTIAGVTNCVKSVVASAIDLNGNRLHERTWNNDFLDLPVIDPKTQRAPGIAREGIQEALSRSQGQFKALCAVLAGTGLRVAEALAIRAVPTPGVTCWDRNASVIHVRTQIQRGREQSPKTAAGVRVVDVPKELNDFLSPEFQSLNGLMFTNAYNSMLSSNSTKLRNAAEKAGVPGFHSFRRFRKTHLENENVPRGLTDFWLGHAGKEIGDRYIRIGQDIAARKEWCAKAGLGFSL